MQCTQKDVELGPKLIEQWKWMEVGVSNVQVPGFRVYFQCLITSLQELWDASWPRTQATLSHTDTHAFIYDKGPVVARWTSTQGWYGIFHFPLIYTRFNLSAWFSCALHRVDSQYVTSLWTHNVLPPYTLHKIDPQCLTSFYSSQGGSTMMSCRSVRHHVSTLASKMLSLFYSVQFTSLHCIAV